MLIGSIGLVLVLSRPRGEHAADACAPILDRYEELRLRASRDKVSPGLLDDMESKVKADVASTEALGECARRLTREEADCALGAATADELERCFP